MSLPMKWICRVEGRRGSARSFAIRRRRVPCPCRRTPSGWRDNRPARPARRRSTCPAHRESGCRSRAHRAKYPSRRGPCRSVPSHSCALLKTSGCSRSRPDASCRVHCCRNVDAFRIRQPEKEMLGRLQYRRRARDCRVWTDEVGRRVQRAAVLAGVAVLILGAAFRAFAADIAVRQEHFLDRVEELLDRLGVDQPGVAELAIDVMRQREIGRRVGAAPVIEAEMKAPAAASVASPISWRPVPSASCLPLRR